MNKVFIYMAMFLSLFYYLEKDSSKFIFSFSILILLIIKTFIKAIYIDYIGEEKYLWKKNNGPDQLLRIRMITIDEEKKILYWVNGVDGHYETKDGEKFDYLLNKI